MAEPMKTLRLTCCNCGRARTFSGPNGLEIMDKIDRAGWRDFPARGTRAEVSPIEAVCQKAACRNALQKGAA